MHRKEINWNGNLSYRVEYRSQDSSLLICRSSHSLADKAYPKWPAEQVKEVLRNQFIHGLRSSSIQLELMKKMPGSMDEVLQISNQQELVEMAQKRLHEEKTQAAEALAVDEQEYSSDSMTVCDVLAFRSRETSSQTEDLVQELAKQLQQSMEEVSQLQSRGNTGQQQVGQRQRRTDVGACWHCG